MAATISWAVTKMTSYTPTDGPADVVLTVHWECNGVQDGHTAKVFEAYNVPAPTASFTPYAELTQEQVLGWVWDGGADKSITEATVQKLINHKINPPMVDLPLPWGA